MNFLTTKISTQWENYFGVYHADLMGRLEFSIIFFISSEFFQKNEKLYANHFK